MKKKLVYIFILFISLVIIPLASASVQVDENVSLIYGSMDAEFSNSSGMIMDNMSIGYNASGTYYLSMNNTTSMPLNLTLSISSDVTAYDNDVLSESWTYKKYINHLLAVGETELFFTARPTAPTCR